MTFIRKCFAQNNMIVLLFLLLLHEMNSMMLAVAAAGARILVIRHGLLVSFVRPVELRRLGGFQELHVFKLFLVDRILDESLSLGL